MNISRLKQEKLSSPQFRILTDILREHEPYMEVAASESGIYYLTYSSESSRQHGGLFAATIDAKKECLLFVDGILQEDFLANLPRLRNYFNKDKKALCFTDMISWDCQWDIRIMLKNVHESHRRTNMDNTDPLVFESHR